MQLKIINCNIWIGGILFENLISFLREEKADILLLQEVYAGDKSFPEVQQRSLQEIKKTLGYSYSSFAPAFFEKVDGKELQQGNAILSNFPLQEKQTTFYDVAYQERDPEDDTKYHVIPRNLQYCIADIQGTDLHLFNTQGIWGEHGGDTDRRMKMADTILSAIPDFAQRIFLSGDFNVDEHTKTIAKIEQKLVNVFKNELKTSFNLKHKDIINNPGYASSVVDMIFVSKSIQVINHYISQQDVSDHIPLVCEINL